MGSVDEAKIDSEKTEVVDASGLIVTPGFADAHTHYDDQVTAALAGDNEVWGIARFSGRGLMIRSETE